MTETPRSFAYTTDEARDIYYRVRMRDGLPLTWRQRAHVMSRLMGGRTVKMSLQDTAAVETFMQHVWEYLSEKIGLDEKPYRLTKNPVAPTTQQNRVTVNRSAEFPAQSIMGLDEPPLVHTRAASLDEQAHSTKPYRDADTLQKGTDGPYEPWEGDHTALVHVLWSARYGGLSLEEDADAIASMIMRSRWLAANRARSTGHE